MRIEQANWILASSQDVQGSNVVGLSVYNGLMYVWAPKVAKAVHPHEFELSKSIAPSDVIMSPAQGSFPRSLQIRDGSVFLVSQTPALNQFLLALGLQKAVVKPHWSKQVRVWFAGILVCLFGLFAAYQWGLPIVADKVAQQLPDSVGQQIGDLSWQQMQAGGTFKTSKIDASRLTNIRERFAALNPPAGLQKIKYDLKFFDAPSIGANAFAMPNGIVVVTDELASLLSDDEIVAVLAHEIGHLHHKHSLRQLVQTSALAVVMSATFGDMSGLGTLLVFDVLSTKYSREAEFESDAYAGKLLRANQLDPLWLAKGLEKLEAKHQEKLPDALKNKPDESSAQDYMSSHPATRDRIERIKQM